MSQTRVLGKIPTPSPLDSTLVTPDQSILLEPKKYRIGSDSTNDIVLTDAFVSRFHCEIEWHDSHFLLRDVGSTNGTFVEGLLIREIPLPLQTEISVGKTMLQFLSLNALGHTNKNTEEFRGMVALSEKMKNIFRLIEKMAPRDEKIALYGETGTGKELVARALHDESKRKLKPFVALNCGAIPKDLIESELFGHRKGAFTGAHCHRSGAFEQARGGTLFLDEIADLPLEIQPKLLRALENSEIKPVGSDLNQKIDARIICASSTPLSTAVIQGRFRQDLFFRLHVIPIFIPPLRERKEDIPILTARFIKELKCELSPAGNRKLIEHDWPGNVRELKNILQRAAAMSSHRIISPENIQFDQLSESVKTLPEMEREAMARALESTNWNQRAAARLLGIPKSTLSDRMKRYNILKKKK